MKIKYFLCPKEYPYFVNANVNVAEIANQYVALTEVPSPILFDINTMDTLGAFQYKDDLPKSHCFESAHMHSDTSTNKKVNYLVKYGLHIPV